MTLEEEQEQRAAKFVVSGAIPRSDWPPLPGVYFARVAEIPDRVKIGRSGCIQKRLADLARMNSGTLEAMAFALGEEPLESSLHNRFRGARLHGEWFRLTDEIQDVIVSYANEWRTKITDVVLALRQMEWQKLVAEGRTSPGKVKEHITDNIVSELVSGDMFCAELCTPHNGGMWPKPWHPILLAAREWFIRSVFVFPDADSGIGIEYRDELREIVDTIGRIHAVCNPRLAQDWAHWRRPRPYWVRHYMKNSSFYHAAQRNGIDVNELVEGVGRLDSEKEIALDFTGH